MATTQIHRPNYEILLDHRLRRWANNREYHYEHLLKTKVNNLRT